MSDETNDTADDTVGAHASGAPWRNFYGRIHGKTLNQAQKDYLVEDLDALAVGAVGWDENPDRIPLDMAARFHSKPVWLEVGFGGGEHLVHMAQTYPEVEIIGCEPFVNGVAMLLGKLRGAPEVKNVSVHAGDVRTLFDILPAGSIEKAFLNYPDPWPKKATSSPSVCHARSPFAAPPRLERWC